MMGIQPNFKTGTMKHEKDLHNHKYKYERTQNNGKN